MCELLGMSFNQAVRPSLSFRGFRQRGKYNQEGWGLGFYPDKAAQIIKEPQKASESRLSEFIRDDPEIRSKLFIAHVRRGSLCKVAYMNTHPFSRELKGKEYIFAQNGTLSSLEKLPLGRFRKIGCTDSEHAFCHILNCVEERDLIRWSDENLDWLTEKLREINDLGHFNCIFSDGEYLFCYYDQGGYSGLCFLHRRAPYGQVQLLDEDFEINLSEEKDPIQRGFIIATKGLTDEPWESFIPGELIVFENGKIVFSSTGRNTESY
jgi:glutamine amidotransferase